MDHRDNGASCSDNRSAKVDETIALPKKLAEEEIIHDDEIKTTDAKIENDPTTKKVEDLQNQHLLASTEDDDTSVRNETEDEEVVTMEDVLKEEEERESDVLAVLGDVDDNFCTYQTDIVARQPLYACNTCEMAKDSVSGEKSLAGFCLACSYHCHEGHEVFELYTKRNFRCDCGNPKFVNMTCKLYEKSDLNEDNRYNHNFSGVYCICNRPYPDPDDTISDVMIQCGLCEDWFHGRHLCDAKDGKKKAEDENFTEMICFRCVKKHPFLIYYKEAGLFDRVEEHDDDQPVDDDNQSDKKSKKSTSNMVDEQKSETIIAENETESKDSGIVASQSQSDAKASTLDVAAINCKLAQAKQIFATKQATIEIDERFLKTLYLGQNWRTALCRCETCDAMYRDHEIEFITSNEDMVYYYEQKTIEAKKRKDLVEEDAGMAALKKLHHVQQIEYIKGYQELRQKLSGFLEKFRAEKRVVTTEDINQFFEHMNSRKRPRFQMPFYCGK